MRAELQALYTLRPPTTGVPTTDRQLVFNADTAIVIPLSLSNNNGEALEYEVRVDLVDTRIHMRGTSSPAGNVDDAFTRKNAANNFEITTSGASGGPYTWLAEAGKWYKIREDKSGGDHSIFINDQFIGSFRPGLNGDTADVQIGINPDLPGEGWVGVIRNVLITVGGNTYTWAVDKQVGDGGLIPNETGPSSVPGILTLGAGSWEDRTLLSIMPAIVGLDQAVADTEISNAGLVTGIVSQLADPAPVGEVIAQEDPPNARLITGTSTNYTISIGGAVDPNTPDIWMKLDETAGSIAVNTGKIASPELYNAQDIFSNDATWLGSGRTWGAGGVTGGASFNNSGTVSQAFKFFNRIPLDGETAFTVAYWVQFRSGSDSNARVFATASSWSETDSQFSDSLVGPTAGRRVWINKVNRTFWRTINLNTDYHIVYTVDFNRGTEVELYIDGTPEFTANVNDPAFLTQADYALALGSFLGCSPATDINSYANGMNGDLADVRMYVGRALTDQEVADLYLNQFP